MKILRLYTLALTLLLAMPQLRAQVIDPFVPYFSILEPQSIAGLYENIPGQIAQFGHASFGSGLANGDIVAEVVFPQNDSLYCDPGSEDFTGKIVLIRRGACTFSEKVYSAEQNGAVGVIIWNFDEQVIDMGYSGIDTPTIASILVPLSVGQAIYDQLQQQQTVRAAFTAAPLNHALIHGKVSADANDNCLPDAPEYGLGGWVVSAQGIDKTYVTYSNAAGGYRLFVDTVNTPYTVTATPPNGYWALCSGTQSVAVNNEDTVAVNFTATAQADCPQLTVDISAPFLRRCFGNDFQVEVCNQGSVVAEAAYVDVTLDVPEFEPISSSTLSFTVISPGVYRFDLGDLAVGACQNFNFRATVSCDSTIIGQTLCYVAQAFPDTLCGVNPNWSGATVSVLGACLGDSVQFQIANTGSAPMISAQDFIIIEDDVMVFSGQFQLGAGEVKLVTLPATGATYRLEAAQEPNHPVPGQPATTVEGCVDGGGNFSTGFYLMFPLYDGGPGEDRECAEIIGSWDPNDKTAYPLGVGPQAYIRPETELEYLIRFQNTGTDTAFNIIVRDTLSAWLDVNTLRPGNSSHPYTLTVVNENQLVFHFDHILLPDSFVNEAGSHGYLTYQINQRADNPNGTVIENRAAIYFDFNPPVLTNTTRHEIGEIPHLSVTTQQPHRAVVPGLLISPNPATAGRIFTLSGALPDGTFWRLFDGQGRLQAAGQIQGQQFSLASHPLPAGIYWLETRDPKTGALRSGTLIIP